MAGVDYAFYRDVYGGGSIPEEDFPRLSARGADYVDLVTAGGAARYARPDVIRRAVCAVAEAWRLNEQGGGIASEENDGLRVNYVAGVSRAKTDDERLYEAAARYLAWTGLLYRGL